MYINITKKIDELKKKRKEQQYINYEKKFTIACDKSPYWFPGNEREFLFREVGIKRARKIAKNWCYKHEYGQARILEGWHYWEGENSEN